MCKVHLIDASPYIFRAHFALPSSMVDPAGRKIGAVYGFASFLLKFLDDESATHAALAFDGSLTTSFRNDLYPDYKAQREAPDPDLVEQLESCREIAEALGFQSFIDDRFEADDLIATWADRLTVGPHAAPDVSLSVVTSDKDLAQLVDRRTVLLDYARAETYDGAGVREKFGVDPKQIPDYLGLAGDAVDNIPGVRGVGKKTAVELLAHFADLSDLFEHLDRVAALPIRGAKSLANKLEDSREIALLSRELATLSTEAPVAGDLDALTVRTPGEELKRVCDRLGFEGLYRRAIERCEVNR